MKGFINERLMTKLGLMQCLTLVSIAGVLVIGVLLVHHQTDDYFTPLPAYLSSIKVAIPPVAIFLKLYFGIRDWDSDIGCAQNSYRVRQKRLPAVLADDDARRGGQPGNYWRGSNDHFLIYTARLRASGRTAARRKFG